MGNFNLYNIGGVLASLALASFGLWLTEVSEDVGEKGASGGASTYRKKRARAFAPKSIQRKILLLMVFAIIFCAAAVGGVAFYSFAQEGALGDSQLAMALCMLVYTALIALSFVFIALIAVRRISRPLTELAEAAREIERGNLDADFPKETDDEIGALTRSMKEMAGHLKVYINDLSSRAYRDPLTKVQNKAAYDEAASRLDAEVSYGAVKEYAIAMFDLNDLKKVNDEYGHECGDLYIKRSCKYMCRVFKHSPVYRVGGDEFAAILKGDDYRDRERLIREFGEGMAWNNEDAKNPWDELHVAIGVSTFDKGLDRGSSDVFVRADRKMYECKRKMKEKEGALGAAKS